MDKKKYWKRYGLWKLRNRLHYLKNERPLQFKFVYKDSGLQVFPYTPYACTLEQIRDPNIIIYLVNIDKKIEETEKSIRCLEGELSREEGKEK